MGGDKNGVKLEETNRKTNHGYSSCSGGDNEIVNAPNW